MTTLMARTFVALTAAVSLLGAASDTAAQSLDPVFPVERFALSYVDPRPDLPELSSLVPFEVELVLGETGWLGLDAAPAGSVPVVVTIGTGEAAGLYHASAISQITHGVLNQVRATGVVGVFVTPHPEDVDVVSEVDLRPAGEGTLRLQLNLGRVRALRSVAFGDRVAGDWKINNPKHRRIRQDSPIQPTAVVRTGTTDLVLKPELEDYLFQVNRYPGRRVEAALAGSEEGDGIALDLLVHEARPWFVYSQTSNTGTPETAVWQTRLGYVNRQLLDRDDTLALQYTNAGGDRVQAINGSYEAPWFSSHRPEWWRSHPDESMWQRWLHRDWLPWWGVDRLRWRIDGSWSRYDARNVETDNIIGSEWNLASRLIYETFQWRNLFVDLFAGTRMRGVDLRNRTFEGTNAETAHEFFFLPEVGAEIERIQETSTLVGFVSYETNVASTRNSQLQNLGRPAVDGKYQLIRYDVGLAQYLEPLLFPSAWEDPATPYSSTLSHEIALAYRGQYAFDYRLIPQASQVIGGMYSVRGYPPSSSVGDTVWVASAEYRFHLPRALPIRNEPLKVPLLGDFRASPQQVYGRPDWDFVLKGFIDAGKTIRNKPRDGAPRPLGETNEFLLGVGFGAELRFRQNLTVRVDWGQALRSTQDVQRGSHEVNLLFSVVY